MQDTRRRFLLKLPRQWGLGLNFGFFFPRSVTNPFLSPEARSFWPAAEIDSSGRNRFSEHVQSNRFIFSGNQIGQICREVRESRTSGVGQSQSSRSLPQVRRIVALGTRMSQIALWSLTRMRPLSHACSTWNLQKLSSWKVRIPSFLGQWNHF